MIVLVCAVLLCAPSASAQIVQEGPKLVGSGAVGISVQGFSVAVSADGNTAIVGGPADNNSAGAAWIWTRSAGVWTQQGPKLVGSGAVGGREQQGSAVALSADGNTAIVGGAADDNFSGAAWIWTRAGGVWTQQGTKLVGSGAVGEAEQGLAVALSADGNTALVGGYNDDSGVGAVWIWIRSGGVWAQQGSKLVGAGATGPAEQGTSVALNADGSMAVVGGPADDSFIGAVWVWTRSGGVWTQQGAKLVASDSVGGPNQGWAVSASDDGATIIVGGPADNTDVGAAWVWTRSGSTWLQQGPRLVGSGGSRASQGVSVSLAGDGNTAIVGGVSDNLDSGATWAWTRSAGLWTQRGSKMVGTGAGGPAQQGWSVALSRDGITAIVGGLADNSAIGAAWVFLLSPPAVTTHPVSQTVAPGVVATFTAAASAAVAVQWQVSSNGGASFTDISGATSTTYQFAAALSDNGKQFRAVFTNGAGATTSGAAVLTVTLAPVIVTQPANQTVAPGSTATFNAAASGSPAVQWQVSADGGSSFSAIPGATSTTYAFTAAVSDNGKRFRAVFTNSEGSTTSNAATLTVTDAPMIVTQPTSQAVTTNHTATFRAAASGNPLPTVQWQVSTDGGLSFTDVAGATATTYAFTAAAADNGKQFRARFTNSSGTATTNAATLTVASVTMSIDKTSLRFSAVTTGTAFTSSTPAQTVRLTQIGAGTVTWTAASTAAWLVVSPTSGSGPATLTVSTQFASGLTESQTGRVILTVTGAGNTPGPIDVTLTTVPASAAVSPPFGIFDTPAGDATVLAGSVAVTGWALDDIGVRRVELWRDLQPGETTPPFASTPSDPRNGKVFIAVPPFVEGARPDVEGLYPLIPRNSRAGWGYLLLTWGLPSQGNGTYRLYAYAIDQENNLATLGTKTIVVNNSAATKPFGTIDTPAIGGEASGPNFGWALTPNVNGAPTCKIQPSGVQVSIDSGPLQPVVYGDARSDIAAAFTGFSNAAAAGGHFIIDWSTLANGVHTIGWLITDDCNRSEGIGSRVFNVTTGLNALTTASDEFRLKAETTEFERVESASLPGSEVSASPPGSVVSASPPGSVGSASLAGSVASAFRRNSAEEEVSAFRRNSAPESAVRRQEGHESGPVLVSRGYGELPEIVPPDEAGGRTIEIQQGGRIEVRVPRGFESAHQIVHDGQRRALPAGSTWDAASGTFYWQPAPGFLGSYRIVFGNGRERISVRVVIVP